MLTSVPPKAPAISTLRKPVVKLFLTHYSAIDPDFSDNVTPSHARPAEPAGGLGTLKNPPSLPPNRGASPKSRISAHVPEIRGT